MSESNKDLYDATASEQIEQIIKAILSGKYSWACVLFLNYACYNPIDYIPYRTYIRLLKNNYLLGKSHQNKSRQNNLELVHIQSTWINVSSGQHRAN
ncbi:MAG: HetP family heterocyst commitment protein [Gloeotrichia echinulata GP01]